MPSSPAGKAAMLDETPATNIPSAPSGLDDASPPAPAPAPEPAAAAAPASGPASALPYWLVNVPPHLHTAECPDFLRNVTDKDREILGTPDHLYQRMTWDEAQQCIAENRLADLQRVPSDLRRYREHMAYLRREYGSVLEYVLKERLAWSDTTAHSNDMFGDERDYKILVNDWPYGWEQGMMHFVIWTKFPIPTDPVTSDLTPAARQRLEQFVQDNFGQFGSENILWFKNWSALKSIHDLEHFHVLLRNPDPQLVARFVV